MIRFFAGLLGGFVLAIAALFAGAAYIGQSDNDGWIEAVQFEQACQDPTVEGSKRIECHDGQRR
jgi:hypothetical protein